MGVVGVLVAKAQAVNSLSELFEPVMDNLVGISVVRQQGSEVLGKAKPIINLTQEQTSGVGGEVWDIKTDIDRL